MILAFFNLLNTLLSLALWVILLSVIFRWLFIWGIISSMTPLLFQLGDVFCRLADAVLKPFRRALPAINGVDISPLAAIIVIVFLQDILHSSFYNNFYQGQIIP